MNSPEVRAEQEMDLSEKAKEFWLKHHREVVRPKYHPDSTTCLACAGMTDIGETMFAEDFAKHLLADSILITREQLESIQFSELSYDMPRCPVCKGIDPEYPVNSYALSEFGHAKTCWLGAALGEKI